MCIVRTLVLLSSSVIPFVCGAQLFVELGNVRLVLPGVHLVVDSVVTGFPDRDPIGMVMKGAFNRPEPAYIRGSTSAALTDLFHRSLPETSTELHVVMKVGALEIREGSAYMHQTAVCSLHAEFLQRDDGRWVRLYDHGTTVSDRGMDVTYMHGSLILEALTECVTAFWERYRAGKLLHDKASPLKERTPVEVLHLPILNMGHMRRGVYHSFQDFRYDIIDTVPVFEVKSISRPGDARVKIKLRTPDLAVQNAWGCSDGSRLYVNTGRSFIELKPARNAFTTFIPFTEGPSGGDVAGAIAAGVLFGMLGAGVAVGVGYRTEELKCDLNMLTGGFDPFHYATEGKAEADTGPPRSRHVFGFSKYSAIDTTVCLYVYDGLEACLNRKQYYDFRPVRRAETMVMEFRVGTNAPVKLELDTNDADDQFFLIKVTAKGEVNVDRVSDEMAIDLLEHLDPGMEVKHQ